MPTESNALLDARHRTLSTGIESLSVSIGSLPLSAAAISLPLEGLIEACDQALLLQRLRQITKCAALYSASQS